MLSSSEGGASPSADEGPARGERLSADRKRAAEYTDTPMPFLIFWFAIPLALIMLLAGVKSHFGW